MSPGAAAFDCPFEGRPFGIRGDPSDENALVRCSNAYRFAQIKHLLSRAYSAFADPRDPASHDIRSFAMLEEAQVSVETFGFIRRLLASENYLLRDHLCRLDSEARHRRFGHDVSDEFIAQYASHASDFGNVTFGYLVEGEVRGIAELRPGALMGRDSAEVAFSVERAFVNRGIATQLMGRIIRTARNRGFSHLTLVCLPDNAKMQAIARHYGAALKIEDGSIFADIVPDRADYQSMVAEMIDEPMTYLHAALDLQTRIGA
jgi:RimJ/RimL family protein N-acetyltransferase